MLQTQNRYYLRADSVFPQSVDTILGDKSLNLKEYIIFDQILKLSHTTDSHTVFASNFYIAMETRGKIDDQLLRWFNNFADAHNFNEDRRRRNMPFYLKDHALVWYNSQANDTKRKPESPYHGYAK